MAKLPVALSRYLVKNKLAKHDSLELRKLCLSIQNDMCGACFTCVKVLVSQAQVQQAPIAHFLGSPYISF